MFSLTDWYLLGTYFLANVAKNASAIFCKIVNVLDIPVIYKTCVYVCVIYLSTYTFLHDILSVFSTFHFCISLSFPHIPFFFSVVHYVLNCSEEKNWKEGMFYFLSAPGRIIPAQVKLVILVFIYSWRMWVLEGNVQPHLFKVSKLTKMLI